MQAYVELVKAAKKKVVLKEFSKDSVTSATLKNSDLPHENQIEVTEEGGPPIMIFQPLDQRFSGEATRSVMSQEDFKLFTMAKEKGNTTIMNLLVRIHFAVAKTEDQSDGTHNDETDSVLY